MLNNPIINESIALYKQEVGMALQWQLNLLLNQAWPFHQT